MTNSLYRVSTERLGTFYVVASSLTKAADKVKASLNKKELGFRSERKVTGVEIVAEQGYDGKFIL